LWFGKGFWLCYEILLAKLNFYSIQGITADWFRSYLTNRWQKVEIKSPNSSQNSFPDWGTMEHGVHQGSILGPLLFIIYMNDLPKGINCLSFSYVHSIIAYSIILWGNSLYSNNIFKVQKRAIRIIVNAGNRVSCRELFKKLNILPLHSQYILSLLMFVVQNIEEFTSNSEVHSINTRHKSDLYPPSIKLTKYQKRGLLLRD